MKSKQNSIFQVIIAFFAGCMLLCSSAPLYPDLGLSETNTMYHSRSKLINIRSTNGKLYAYIVLLFNENPHFVNLIQEGSIPLDLMQKDGFRMKQFSHYLKSIKDRSLKRLAKEVLELYEHPSKFKSSQMEALQKKLEKRNVVLRFSRSKVEKTDRVVLDYCIFGKKTPINIAHPLFNISERIYNIQPFIYYNEFLTSNSTFYFDMIYINPEEVHNDYIIARKVKQGKSVNSMFFVGAHVSDEIRYCLKHAFSGKNDIKGEIWRLFEIHELTHKILNNHYDMYDQVTGEELALSSTVFYNPYLGLAVMYSYLDYNAINPHRIAAYNFLKFIARHTGNNVYIKKPSSVKDLSADEIKKIARQHFNATLKDLK
ncbi:MAG: hypothetical protein ACOCX9_03570 [Spirochaetota bacterium]